MGSSITGNLPKNGQTLVDKAADAGAALSKTVGRAQSLGRQGFHAVGDAAQRAPGIASDTSDSIIRLILIAAASGALLLSVMLLL